MKKIFSLLTLGVIVFLSSCDNEDDKYFGDNTSLGAIMTLQGGTGGASAINSVYVDFNIESQTSIERVSWHLAFNCGNDFGVFLNSTIGARATEAEANVTVATVLTQAENDVYKNALSLGMGEGSWDILDDLSGDITKTAIKEGKVYLYDSEAGLELYKLSVTKKDANTYTLTYALWNSSIEKSVDIVKNKKYDILGASLVSGKTLTIQPEKEDWDIVWGRNTYKAGTSPYIMADIVFLNTKNGVQAAQIMSETVSFDNYGEPNIATTTFSSDRDVIGSGWRNGGGPGVDPSTKGDRFYIIKDTDGNIYKMRFVSMTATEGGERGKPEIEYALVKKG